MDIVGALVNLAGGAIGGNILGASWKDKSLGAIGNTIAGAVGGVAGTYILQAVNLLQTVGLADMTIGSFAAQGGTAAISGAVLTAIVGLIKSKMGSK